MDSVSSAVSYNCPNCGAELLFDAGKQKLCCEFCESEFTTEEIDESKAESAKPEQKTEDFIKEKDSSEYNDHMNEYECPNCGAQIAAEENTAADICIYCHSPVMLKGKLTGELMPDKVIPFRYGKEEAEKKFLDFTKKRWFLPDDFRSKSHADKISGVYYPFWVTDADTDGFLSASATKIRKWRRGNYEYTETSNYRIRRAGYIHFEDIVTSAITKEDKEMLEGILPYPSDSMQPFSMSYLSGFTAKKRNIEISNISGEVRDRMEGYSQTLLKNTIRGYSTVSISEKRLRINDSRWEYTLMPIWVLNYITPKKTYTFAMNGHTGKIYGSIPLSIKKLLIFCGSLFAGAAAILAVIGGLFI